MLAFRDEQDARNSARQAIHFCTEMLSAIAGRNAGLPAEQAISLRFAVHFGEVDVIENDREGPNVSFAFRLEAISGRDLDGAMSAVPSDQFPLRNHILCSEQVVSLLDSTVTPTRLVGIFKLKGFSGWHEVSSVTP